MKDLREQPDKFKEAYHSLPVEKTHSREELDNLHACIRYTHMFKHAESMSKHDEEIPAINLPLPDIGNFGATDKRR